jgi:hypothetical protein
VWVLVPIMGGGVFMTHYLLGLRRDGDGKGSTLELAQRGGGVAQDDLVHDKDVRSLIPDLINIVGPSIRIPQS